MRSYYFMPLIQQATRFPVEPGLNPSLIDHIWTNFIDIEFNCGSILVDYTDHCPIFINIKTPAAAHETIKVKFRNFSERCIVKFREDLSDIDWCANTFDNINDRMEFLEGKMQACFIKNFPIKTKCISVNHINKPWITNAIKRSIKTKSNYFKLMQRGIISKHVNDNYKKYLRRIIRAAKRN